MQDQDLFDEIMREVENLTRSIEECCPEIVLGRSYGSEISEEDDMSRLIDHRISILTEYSRQHEETKF